MTPRDIGQCVVGQCKYAPVVDENGGIVNDPLILRLADDHFWISVADSDVLLWAKGIAAGRGFDVDVREPDVSPLALQGPLADDVAEGRLRCLDADVALLPVSGGRGRRDSGGGRAVGLEQAGWVRDLSARWFSRRCTVGSDSGRRRAVRDPGRMPEPHRTHREPAGLVRQRRDARRRPLPGRARSLLRTWTSRPSILPVRPSPNAAEGPRPAGWSASSSGASVSSRTWPGCRCMPVAVPQDSSRAQRTPRGSRRTSLSRWSGRNAGRTCCGRPSWTARCVKWRSSGTTGLFETRADPKRSLDRGTTNR